MKISKGFCRRRNRESGSLSIPTFSHLIFKERRSLNISISAKMRTQGGRQSRLSHREPGKSVAVSSHAILVLHTDFLLARKKDVLVAFWSQLRLIIGSRTTRISFGRGSCLPRADLLSRGRYQARAILVLPQTRD